MQPLIVTLVLCAALVAFYPPAALAIFVIGAALTGWAAWRKARERDAQAKRDDAR
jgi:threonine/homoserine/homoserine lactone efflux protein